MTKEFQCGPLSCVGVVHLNMSVSVVFQHGTHVMVIW